MLFYERVEPGPLVLKLPEPPKAEEAPASGAAMDEKEEKTKEEGKGEEGKGEEGREEKKKKEEQEEEPFTDIDRRPSVSLHLEVLYDNVVWGHQREMYNEEYFDFVADVVEEAAKFAAGILAPSSEQAAGEEAGQGEPAPEDVERAQEYALRAAELLLDMTLKYALKYVQHLRAYLCVCVCVCWGVCWGVCVCVCLSLSLSLPPSLPLPPLSLFPTGASLSQPAASLLPFPPASPLAFLCSNFQFLSHSLPPFLLRCVMHSADDNVRGSLRYWPQHLAALMSCSAAVRELARTRLVGQEPIVKFLIVNSNDDAREVFAQMLHECVRQTYLHDGLENGHNTLAVVMQFAVQAMQTIGLLQFSQLAELFNLLLKFASIGSFQRSMLVELEAIEPLFTFFEHMGEVVGLASPVMT